MLLMPEVVPAICQLIFVPSYTIAKFGLADHEKKKKAVRNVPVLGTRDFIFGERKKMCKLFLQKIQLLRAGALI